MKWAIVAAICLAVAGCAVFQTEAVYLDRPIKDCQPGKDCMQHVHCGPYERVGGAGEGVEEEALRHCVEDFQRAGFERVQAPAK